MQINISNDTFTVTDAKENTGRLGAQIASVILIVFLYETSKMTCFAYDKFNINDSETHPLMLILGALLLLFSVSLFYLILKSINQHKIQINKQSCQIRNTQTVGKNQKTIDFTSVENLLIIKKTFKSFESPHTFSFYHIFLEQKDGLLLDTLISLKDFDETKTLAEAIAKFLEVKLKSIITLKTMTDHPFNKEIKILEKEKFNSFSELEPFIVSMQKFYN